MPNKPTDKHTIRTKKWKLIATLQTLRADKQFARRAEEERDFENQVLNWALNEADKLSLSADRKPCESLFQIGEFSRDFWDSISIIRLLLDQNWPFWEGSQYINDL